MAIQQQAAPADNRIHSTVYHKSDSRLNDILRRCKKSEIISLHDIEAMMLFRVEAAHIQFDMLQNHRPYIVFQGKTDGVFLPAKTGLLFPNACDQLDFRQDKPIDALVTYALSDLEIATLANNGLYNYDYSCQGRIIGSLLEIPCIIDYNAIANTPITYVEIQDRLSLKTSTRKTGYKTIVAAFLPYSAQTHNLEERAVLVEAEEFDRNSTEIRKRALYDTKPIAFETMPLNRQMKEGASFVETAQDRIQNLLQNQMAKANVLEMDTSETSKQIADAVKDIKSQTDKTRKQTMFELEQNANKLEAATLDARLNDISNRMVYAGAQTIPVETEDLNIKPLVEKPAPNVNDKIMTTPITETTDTPETIAETNRKNEEQAKQAAADIAERDDKLHQNMFDAESTAKDVVDKALTRKEKLAMRRQQRRLIQQRALEAGQAEASGDMTTREQNSGKDTGNATTGEKPASAKAKMDNQLKSDILSADIDIDDIIETLGMEGDVNGRHKEKYRYCK